MRMDNSRKRCCIFSLLFHICLVFVPFVSSFNDNNQKGVFKVHHKFLNRERATLISIKAHDTHRHRRILSAIDLPLGGNGSPTGTGLYYAKIGIGSPPKDYHVQIDTGSDLLWVNCVQCTTCPKKSDLGIKLQLYNPKESVTSKVVSCDDDFCANIYEGSYPGCTANKLCDYRVVYADGSASDGYYVQDYITYDKASGNLATSPGNGSVIFGCGAKQSGDLGSDKQALDGIVGFGQANSSMISQLASSGLVKKVFSHCLDGQNGGGIYAIGQVVQPKVKSTPLVPKQAHYNVNLKEIEVGKDTLDLPSDAFETGDRKGTIIDSGTTLAYLPDEVYAPLIQKILSSQPALRLQTVEDNFQCFPYTGSVDDGFPAVTFHFEDSLTLMVYPHDYMFKIHNPQELWCIGWQNGGLQSKDGKDIIILGDLVLSNKLVVYDLENQVIGWTDYNCSSSIKLLDEQSGNSYLVGAHDLSSASLLDMGRNSILLLMFVMLHVIYF
ncbi:hypothetical protein IFM89_038072 [Coptis chinensis]|uniref:Peptidase A1 domain-containing protein n=1 Tax=Coptis chinensis TaxID=261450 RepID=A0A835I8U4_9MAGN|nr:hypothetical protein IFM89_038072 [Coptis chinensis]